MEGCASALVVCPYSRNTHKYAPFVGPVVFVAMGYMDPGNWATAIEGGSRFGFELLWVVVLSNMMAVLFQTLAIRLELVTGKRLAQICRDDYPQPVCISLWVLFELSIVALELTMVLGMAIGLNLLLGIPILPGVFLLVFDTMVFQVVLPLLGVQSVEVLTRTVVGVIMLCFGLDALLGQPNAVLLAGGMWPNIRGETLYTAMALVGANVMPCRFYLYSPLAKRQITDGGQSVEAQCEKSMWDAIGAFGLATVANVVLLIVSATSFYNAGLVVLTLQDAHELVEQVFSKSIAPAVFGLAMLCVGQMSTHTGSLAGQAALEGFLDTKIQPWVHQSAVRMAAILPTAFFAWHYGNEGLYQLLVFAQVILALLLPFAALPLIKASASEARMGSFRMSLPVEALAWVSVAMVVVADIWLVFDVVLQEIDEFAGFAAHLEHLMGTDSFSNYGGETVNVTVFALALVGISLCIGFLVWLVVTPLRVDREAMERKWVEEYERFERNEVAERLRIGAPIHYELNSSSAIVEDDILADLDSAEDVVTLPEPESQVLEDAELERLVNSSGSISADDSKCADLPAEVALTTKAGMVPKPPCAELSADDLGCMGLKKAESQVDTELLEKDDDEGDGWENPEHGGLVVDTMVTGSLGANLGSIAHDSSSSIWSVGGRTETAEEIVCRSGSGSLSRISGLGRAARRQFAAILDNFWSRLFDLHGQPVKGHGSATSGRMTGGGAVGRGPPIQQQVDHGSLPVQSGSIDTYDRDNYGLLLKPKWGLPKKGTLRDQVGQMDAYMRAHSHAAASTSLHFPGHSHDYSGRSENLSPYTSERQYSSLHLPLYPEETEKQPATIHGYRSPSFLGRTVTTSPAHMDMHAFRSARTLSGQARPQQPLGIGVERENDNYQLYGHSLQSDSRISVQDTIQSFRSSQQIVDSLGGRIPVHSQVSDHLVFEEGYGGQPDSGPRSWDSLLTRAALGRLAYRATGELDIPTGFAHSPVTRGAGHGIRAPLSFDQISPSQSCRDGFSIQSGHLENQSSLWSREPSEQLFGALDGSLGRVKGGGVQASGQNGNVDRFTTAIGPEGITNTATSTVNGVDFELEVMESLRLCLSKLLQLEGSEWLFRWDNGSDEDLIATVAKAQNLALEAEAHDRNSSTEQWQVHGHPVPSLFASNDPQRISCCGVFCVWGSNLLISFGVWCIHRVLELSLMESRPELWGKYTYVLNRLQGILEPAFSKPRVVPSLCSCFSEPGSAENLGKQGLTVSQQRSSWDSGIGDPYSPSVGGGLSDTYPWPWGHESSSLKGRGADATIFLEMIKEVEAAVGSRKGRTGTAAGDVAFPKGKENLASVLKRYKRRLANKPPGSLVAGGGGRRGNGYA
ncbi:unnamed protein product [Sphagnum troendelagicum]|uniref:Natural resistance-associated macrophage protein n=1 Tax=Sphagnum troendelagicum TaxID=128251 RepID=A0ABP0UB04_9BRYO